jgi:hypothetical protein
LASALFAGIFYGPVLSYASGNFGGKSIAFRLLTPPLAIAFWGTILFWGFSILAAILTQLPLIFLNRVPFFIHLPISIALGLLLFWFLFPFPMGTPQGWDPTADGGLIAPLLLGIGGSVGLALLWRWLVFSRLGNNA